MDFLQLFTSALGTASLIALLVFFLYRTAWMRRLACSAEIGYQLLLAGIFGVLSIYASVAAQPVQMTDSLSAFCSVRDMAPLFAGLCGGPIAGIGAGLIGALYRFFVGAEFTRIACSLSVLLSGVIGGMLYYSFRRRPVKPIFGLLIASLTELLHMGFILLFSVPFDQAANLVFVLAGPMLLINALGLFVCLYLYRFLMQDTLQGS